MASNVSIPERDSGKFRVVKGAADTAPINVSIPERDSGKFRGGAKGIGQRRDNLVSIPERDSGKFRAQKQLNQGQQNISLFQSLKGIRVNFGVALVPVLPVIFRFNP